MEARELKVGQRVYHGVFGWCKITHPIDANDVKCLVDLEADEIEYYTIGKGYASYSRDKESGLHTLYTPIKHLYESEEQAKIDTINYLRVSACNPKLIFWEKN